MNEHTTSLKATRLAGNSLTKKLVLILFVFGVLLLAVLLIAPALQQPPGLALPERVISASTLEEQYGLRVYLIAVTAAGGMVDVRLNILDAQKASQLWQPNPDYPALRLESNGMILKTSEETLKDVQLKDGEPIFLMYPNAKNMVKAGAPISLIFQDARLEPINSK
jgi:hypothetical protein